MENNIINKETILRITSNNIKTIIIFIGCFIGAFFCYTYLDYIDAIEIFTLNSISLFSTLFFLSILTTIFLSFLFAIPYLYSYFLNKYIDKDKVNIIALRQQQHEISCINIILIPFSLLCLIYLNKFHLSEHKDKFNQDYLLSESIAVHSIILIIPAIMAIIFTNTKFYKFLTKNTIKQKNRIEYFFNYLLYALGLPYLFLLIWFITSIFSGIDLLKNSNDFSIFIIYFTILILIYAIPMEQIELTIPDKIMKIISMSIISISLMGMVSLFFETSFIYSLMKIVGKADKRDYPYVIHQKIEYNLPDVENNIYCSKVLWRDDNITIILLQNELNKKNRIMINKKDIYPLQGKERLTYCKN